MPRPRKYKRPTNQTVTFEETDGRTLLVMSEVFPTKEALDAEGVGAAEATRETFAQLDELLVTLA